MPSFAHPQGAVGSLEQAAGKLQGEARVLQGAPSPRDFQVPRERSGLSAFRQDGAAGSNCYVNPGETGLCLGSAWHLINGSHQCSNWKSKFLFPQAPGITGWSLLVAVTPAHYTRPHGSGHPSRCFSRLPEWGTAHGLQTWFEPHSCCMTRGKCLSHSESHVPICTTGILMPAEDLGQSWESRASTREAINSL